LITLVWVSRKQGQESDIEAVYRAVRDAYADVVQPASSVPAVAVVLWRFCKGKLQVYLVERHAELRFLGGYWSFPGGRLEPSDEAVAVRGAAGDAAVRIAAAVREVREELGVELPLDADRYLDGGCWVTPSFSPTRFHASYLLHHYEGREPDPSCSGQELTDGRWLSPTRLYHGWLSGDLLVPPPVLRVVMAMGSHRAELGSGAHTAVIERLEREVREQDDAPRVWFPVAGVGICPLRTPTLPPATHTNAYFLGIEDMVLVDPGTPYPDELAVLDHAISSLRSEGRTVREVLLTHHHGDHVGAARHLSETHGLPIAAHRETAVRLDADLPIARYLEDHDLIELGGTPPRRIRVLFTPGHAPGHLCFLEEETGFAAVGDMVAGTGTILIDPGEGDMAQYLASLGRLRAAPIRALLPAHGPVITNPAHKLDEYVEHRLWREAQVALALSAETARSAAELVSLVYQDVAAAVHPVAVRSLLAHLSKLEAEGRARREGDRWLAIGSS